MGGGQYPGRQQFLPQQQVAVRFPDPLRTFTSPSKNLTKPTPMPVFVSFHVSLRAHFSMDSTLLTKFALYMILVSSSSFQTKSSASFSFGADNCANIEN